MGWLREVVGLPPAGAEQALRYVAEGRRVLSVVPTLERIAAERFFDESGGMQLVLHSPWGARINRAWGLALRKRFCRSFDFELQASATDDGIVLSLGPQHSFPLEEIARFLRAGQVQETLVQAVLASPIFATRWRWTLTRSLALLRFARGRRVPAAIQRMRADDMLSAVFGAEVRRWTPAVEGRNESSRTKEYCRIPQSNDVMILTSGAAKDTFDRWTPVD
jgi:ATP-dependent Lhr-like helicase